MSGSWRLNSSWRHASSSSSGSQPRSFRWRFPRRPGSSPSETPNPQPKPDSVPEPPSLAASPASAAWSAGQLRLAAFEAVPAGDGRPDRAPAMAVRMRPAAFAIGVPLLNRPPRPDRALRGQMAAAWVETDTSALARSAALAERPLRALRVRGSPERWRLEVLVLPEALASGRQLESSFAWAT